MRSTLSVTFLSALAVSAIGCAHNQQAKLAEPAGPAAAPASLPPQAAQASPGTASGSASEGVPALEPIHFDFDQAQIQPSDENELAAIGSYLVAHLRPLLTISGHCDERGTVEYNIALGDRRAQAARAYLVRMGVSGSRIKTISYGKARPLETGHDEQAWAKNRRDEFELRAAQQAAR